MPRLVVLLSLHSLSSSLAIVCFTDIACLMLPHGEFACNNTALIDCTESQACLSYYSAPGFTQSPSSWSSSTWSPRLRGCASDDVVTALFDTATGWSARCGFGGERLIEDMVILMRDSSNSTETVTIPILASSDSTPSSTLVNNTLPSDNNTLSAQLLLSIKLNATNSSQLNFAAQKSSTISPSSDFTALLTNETMENSASAYDTLIEGIQSSAPSTTTDLNYATTTSEIDPGVAISDSPLRIRRDPMVPAGYAGCLCYSDGCNGPEEKYLEEIGEWLEKRAAEAEGRGEGVEVKTTDYEDTGAEPISQSG